MPPNDSWSAAPCAARAWGTRCCPSGSPCPVFASDALSSVAYAPDEILLTLSLAGIAAVAFSPWVGLVVVVVLLIVVASYRQNVHAYPSGGGDYEVATVNLGPKAGVGVASALLVDYVLTVAVSISSAAQYASAAIPGLRGHEALAAVIAVVLLTLVNLRGVKESGTAFAVPVYCYMAVIGALVRHRRVPLLRRGPAEGPERRVRAHRRGRVRPGPGRRRRRLPPGPRVRVRLRRPDRRRGHQQRRAVVPQAQVAQRRDHAAAARHHLLDDDPLDPAARAGHRRPLRRGPARTAHAERRGRSPATTSRSP